jgi:hypothetical protein
MRYHNSCNLEIQENNFQSEITEQKGIKYKNKNSNIPKE